MPYIVVFLNKCDMVEDPELLEFVEWKSASFERYGSPATPSLYPRSALQALKGDEKWEQKILELMEAMDTNIPPRCAKSTNRS